MFGFISINCFWAEDFFCKYGKPNLNNLYKSAEIKADRKYVEQLIIIQKQFFLAHFESTNWSIEEISISSKGAHLG